MNKKKKKKKIRSSKLGCEVGMAPSPSPDSPDSDLVRCFADSDSTSGLESVPFRTNYY